MTTTLKKIISLVLCAALFGSCVPGLVAFADAVPYTLTFVYTDAEGKVTEKESSLIAGAAILGDSYMPAAGQQFKGWYKDADLTDPAPSVMPAEDLTLYAAMQCFTVTYTLNGNNYGSGLYFYGEKLKPPTVEEKTGYTFSGWTDERNNKYKEDDPVLSNMALSASHVQNNYNVTCSWLDKDGKTQTQTQVYHYDDVLDLPAIAADTGYSFSGWFTDKDLKKAAPEKMPDGNLELYGEIRHEYYTIYYYVNGKDTGIEQTEYHYGDTITPITAYDDLIGQTFSGWFADEKLTEKIPETMPDHNLIFYGKLTDKTYTLTYYINNEFYNYQIYSYDQVLTLLSGFAKDDEVFSGWKREDGTSVPIKMPAGNLNVYGTLTKIPESTVSGGPYENITRGDSVQVILSLNAPMRPLNSLTISDIEFDTDVLMLNNMQWLCSGTTSADLGNRLATFHSANNTDLNGELLLLEFESLDRAPVGFTEVTYKVSATTNKAGANADVEVTAVPVSVQVICGTHNYTGGRVVANKNNTHSVYCANNCGVCVQQSCSGGTATCLKKAVCSVCKAEYGQKAAHDYSGEPRANNDGTHSYRCVSGCGEYGGAKVACTYGVALNNGDNTTHKITCIICGYSTNENCYGGTATCLKVAFCELCKKQYGDVLPHSYTGAVKTNYDGTHVRLCVNGCEKYGGKTDCTYSYVNTAVGVHTKTCTACGYVIDEYCSGGKATCLKLASCAFCKTDYGERLEHSYTGTARANSDKNTHSLQCVNGCGKYGSPIACTAGEYVSNSDGTHSAHCTVCDAVMTGKCGGGSATCIARARCVVCGAEHGEMLKHDYSGAYTPVGDGTHAKQCINGCNLPGGEAIACTYGEWVGDGVSAHVKTCSVCNGTVSENCVGGTATCTAKAICDVCKVAYGEFLPHTFPEGAQGLAKSNNDGTHTRYCTACRQNVILTCNYTYIPNRNGTHIAACADCKYTISNQACFGGNATCLVAAVCDGCKEKYGDLLPHSYEGEARDNGDGTHCLQCINGCEQFGGDRLPCTPGEYKSNGDDTHSALCTACSGVLTGKCSGGTANCDKQAICEICLAGYGRGGDHDYQMAQDDTHHWGQCSVCGKTTPREAHTFTAWTILEEATAEKTGLGRRLCTGCGKVVVRVLPRVFAMGDVDFDGSLSSADARLALRAAVGLETLSAAAAKSADVDRDGIILSADARLLLRASVGLEDTSSWDNIGVDNAGNLLPLVDD